MKAMTRSTPSMKVAVSLPFHGRITFISAATTWYQVRPSALMMPSVTVLTAPPGVSATDLRASAAPAIVDRARRGVCCSRACSAIRPA